MEQGQNTINTQVNEPVSVLEQNNMVVEPTAGPVTGENTMAAGASEKKKGGKGLVIGMVLCLILAVGGIGFGVWAMMDGNQQKDALNQQISSLKRSIDELQNEASESNGEIISGSINPVIVSSEPGEVNTVDYIGYTVDSNAYDEKKVEIYVKDGAVSTCRVNGNDCVIEGITGEIYQIVDFGAGMDGSGFNIGFIMKDGTVEYIPLPQSDKTVLEIAGTLNIDGYVVDVVPISVSSEGEMGGYASTVFRMSDGSFEKFDRSML